MADFSKEITGGVVASWANLMTLLIAAGYTGGSVTTNLTLEEENGALERVKHGHTSTTVAPVSGTDGTPLSNKARTDYGIDMWMTWVFFPANTDKISVTFHSDVDF